MSTLDVCAHTVMDCASSRTRRMCASLPSGAMDDTNAALHNKIAEFLWGTLDVSDWASRVCLDGDQKRPSLIKFFCVFSAADIWGFDWISFESQP